jgi:hypothetical protein
MIIKIQRINKFLSNRFDREFLVSEVALFTQQSVLNTKPSNIIWKLDKSMSSVMNLVDKISKFDGNQRIKTIRKQQSSQLLNTSLDISNKSIDVTNE